MKRKIIITLILTIILSMFLAGTVSAEGMERKALRSGEAADNAQPANVLDGKSHPIQPCIISRGYGFMQFGSPHGMYGCLNRPTTRFELKHRW
jgi:hypothetical protein